MSKKQLGKTAGRQIIFNEQHNVDSLLNHQRVYQAVHIVVAHIPEQKPCHAILVWHYSESSLMTTYH
jgi:hypothetical protein